MGKLIIIIPILILSGCVSFPKSHRFKSDFVMSKPKADCKCEEDIKVKEIDLHFGPGPLDDINDAEPSAPKESPQEEDKTEASKGWFW